MLESYDRGWIHTSSDGALKSCATIDGVQHCCSHLFNLICAKFCDEGFEPENLNLKDDFANVLAFMRGADKNKKIGRELWAVNKLINTFELTEDQKKKSSLLLNLDVDQIFGLRQIEGPSNIRWSSLNEKLYSVLLAKPLFDSILTADDES